MKFILLLILMIGNVFAQDTELYLKNFENKIYSLKTKGVQDFAVDIESKQLTQLVNDQQSFGKVEELIFRAYWTLNPERFSIEVIGLPDGFKEFKDELKLRIYPVLEYLIPKSMNDKFKGYKFSTTSPGRILAQDSTGVAATPSFQLNFNAENKLVEIIGNRPIGTMIITPRFEKKSFADDKWVLEEEIITTTENSQTLSVTKEMSYDKFNGIQALDEIEVTTKQVVEGKSSKSVETINFKNYKINEGVALKYFLGQENLSKEPKKIP